MISLVVGLFGLVLGSFLNVVIHRVPLHRYIVSPSSSCPNCGARIKTLDNVPVLSYLLLRGRCQQCGVRISPPYPSVEALTGVLFALALAYPGGMGMGDVKIGVCSELCWDRTRRSRYFSGRSWGFSLAGL